MADDTLTAAKHDLTLWIVRYADAYDADAPGVLEQVERSIDALIAAVRAGTCSTCRHVYDDNWSDAQCNDDRDENPMRLRTIDSPSVFGCIFHQPVIAKQT